MIRPTLTDITFILLLSLLRHISNKFNKAESREVSLNGNKHDFSVDYNSFDKSDMLNIHKYLMENNNIK